MFIHSIDEALKEMEDVKEQLLELGLMYEELKDFAYKAKEIELKPSACTPPAYTKKQLEELVEMGEKVHKKLSDYDMRKAFEFIENISQLRTDIR